MRNSLHPLGTGPGFEGRKTELLDYTPVVHPGTELVEFSPTKELNETMSIVVKNMEGM